LEDGSLEGKLEINHSGQFSLAHRGQGHGFPGIWHRLGHDEVSAIGQMVDTPQLFGTAGKNGNRYNFTVNGCSSRAICAANVQLASRPCS
jgi:hypothetical protein